MPLFGFWLFCQNGFFKVVYDGLGKTLKQHFGLDEKSSGLTYAIATLGNHPRVGVTIFKETVRLVWLKRGCSIFCTATGTFVFAAVFC